MSSPIFLAGEADTWWTAPRGWADVARCLFGRHLIAMSVILDGRLIDRCTCGAIRMNGSYWVDARPWTRRSSGELDDDEDDQPEPKRRPTQDDECPHARYLTGPCEACGRPNDEEDER